MPLFGCCPHADTVASSSLSRPYRPATWAQPARRGIVRSRTGLVALVIFVLVVGAACTSGSASRSSLPASPTTAAHHVTDTTGTEAAADGSPKELGAQFEQLLGQHALLAMRLMRSAVMNASEFRQVAETSLEANTDALSQLVGTAYDDTQGDRFKQLWQGYVTDLSAYANGAASQDASAKQAARASPHGLLRRLRRLVGRGEQRPGPGWRRRAGRADARSGAHQAGRRLCRRRLRPGIQDRASGLPEHVHGRGHAGQGERHPQGRGRPGCAAGAAAVGVCHAAG